jgi:hypothetical protein
MIRLRIQEIFDLMAERGLCRTHLEVPPWGDGDADRVAAVETLQIEVFWMALNQKVSSCFGLADRRYLPVTNTAIRNRKHCSIPTTSEI